MKQNQRAAAFVLSALIAVASAACVQISEPGPSDSTATHSTNFSTTDLDDIDGTVTMNVTTDVINPAGKYSPGNVVALWVEDEAGFFVRTLGVRAATRKKYLVSWIGSQGGSTVDGLTGATRSDHTVDLEVTWDGTNIADSRMKAGIYRLRGEITDHNGSGATFSLDINVSGDADSVSLPSANGFASVSAEYAIP